MMRCNILLVHVERNRGRNQIHYSPPKSSTQSLHTIIPSQPSSRMQVHAIHAYAYTHFLQALISASLADLHASASGYQDLLSWSYCVSIALLYFSNEECYKYRVRGGNENCSPLQIEICSDLLSQYKLVNPTTIESGSTFSFRRFSL
jgi:hypothetical protein